jgi:membrane peptidoglycan carboxypeptidase
VRMDPYLVSEIRSGQGDVLETFEPREVERAVSERAARLTARAMETVTTEDGTASAAAIPGFSVAGKTGTAFLVSPNGGYTDDYLSAFTGFVPAEDPVIAISVIVERPNPDIGFYGGAVAAPVFRDVAIEALVREGLLPAAEVEEGGEDADSVARGAVASQCPEIAADTVPCWLGGWPGEVVTGGEWLVSVSGVGRVVRQSPAPGSDVPDIRRVTLWLESEAHELP